VTADVCAACGKTREWHKKHRPRHVFTVRLDESTLVGSHPEASATPLVSMDVDHLEAAFQAITELFDDLNLHPGDHSVASIRRRMSRVREHLVHARDQRVLERNAR
jgi:hypothetical protein